MWPASFSGLGAVTLRARRRCVVRATRVVILLFDCFPFAYCASILGGLLARRLRLLVHPHRHRGTRSRLESRCASAPVRPAWAAAAAAVEIGLPRRSGIFPDAPRGRRRPGRASWLRCSGGVLSLVVYARGRDGGVAVRPAAACDIEAAEPDLRLPPAWKAPSVRRLPSAPGSRRLGKLLRLGRRRPGSNCRWRRRLTPRPRSAVKASPRCRGRVPPDRRDRPAQDRDAC